MNHPFLVGVLDGIADLDEKVQPLASGELVLVAVIGDRDAAHQFHDKEGASGVRRAGFQHFGDVGMFHHGQRLALRLETGHDLLGVHAQLDDLERHTAADRLLLFGHIDRAKTAFADFFEQFVTANGITRLLSYRVGSPRGQSANLQEIVILIIAQQRVHRRSKGVVTSANPFQISRPGLGCGLIQRLQKNVAFLGSGQ